MIDVNHLNKYTEKQIQAEYTRLVKCHKRNKIISILLLTLTVILFISSLVFFLMYLNNMNNNDLKFTAYISLGLSLTFIVSLIFTLYIFIFNKIKVINQINEIIRFNNKSNE